MPIATLPLKLQWNLLNQYLVPSKMLALPGTLLMKLPPSVIDVNVLIAILIIVVPRPALTALPIRGNPMTNYVNYIINTYLLLIRLNDIIDLLTLITPVVNRVLMRLDKDPIHISAIDNYSSLVLNVVDHGIMKISITTNVALYPILMN